MRHVENELPEGLSGLRSQELCAWLDLGLEHTSSMVWVPVDLETGEVLSTPERWRSWLRDNPERLVSGARLRANSRKRRRRPGAGISREQGGFSWS